ncbi:hypothetical protein CCHR01_18952 [Colletotrichum chrysophilum]|uniref:Uncharacterized protein n=1 Tax=Colletotrichum chrysophilum TaxID=1836956 RepID=A0AAD9E882_9PEZI|nr:hypothetical protein CCHR01_18952 [Colletotrichum chrysophilum]
MNPLSYALYFPKGIVFSYLLDMRCVVNQKSEKLGHADNSMALPKGHRVLFKREGLIILDVKTMNCWLSWFFVKWQTVKHRSVGVLNANVQFIKLISYQCSSRYLCRPWFIPAYPVRLDICNLFSTCDI